MNANINKTSKVTKVTKSDSELLQIKVKTQHIIGEKRLIDQESGEIVTCVVVEKEVNNDFNFHKVWLNDLMNILGLIGTKKVEVLKYLLGNLINEENLIVVSYKEIEEELGISSRTIAQTFKILQEANFLNQIKKGIWRVNPSFLIKGKSQKRQNIMIKYVNEINERLKQKDN